MVCPKLYSIHVYPCTRPSPRSPPVTSNSQCCTSNHYQTHFRNCNIFIFHFAPLYSTLWCREIKTCRTKTCRVNKKTHAGLKHACLTHACQDSPCKQPLSLWVFFFFFFFFLRFISDDVFHQRIRDFASHSVSSISIQCMVDEIRLTVLTT